MFCYCLFPGRSMQQSVSSYLGEVLDAWNDYDGEALARLLSFRDQHVMVTFFPIFNQLVILFDMTPLFAEPSSSVGESGA